MFSVGASNVPEIVAFPDTSRLERLELPDTVTLVNVVEPVTFNVVPIVALVPTSRYVSLFRYVPA